MIEPEKPIVGNTVPDLAPKFDPRGTALSIENVSHSYGARRALEVAAAGGHHLLLVGPPGTGKTMLAQRLIGLLPPLRADEALQHFTVEGIKHNIPLHLRIVRDEAFKQGALDTKFLEKHAKA